MIPSIHKRKKGQPPGNPATALIGMFIWLIIISSSVRLRHLHEYGFENFSLIIWLVFRCCKWAHLSCEINLCVTVFFLAEHGVDGLSVKAEAREGWVEGVWGSYNIGKRGVFLRPIHVLVRKNGVLLKNSGGSVNQFDHDGKGG